VDADRIALFSGQNSGRGRVLVAQSQPCLTNEWARRAGILGCLRAPARHRPDRAALTTPNHSLTGHGCWKSWLAVARHSAGRQTMRPCLDASQAW
jgi:hypothetical protein